VLRPLPRPQDYPDIGVKALVVEASAAARSG
jgi:hypothetical protein